MKLFYLSNEAYNRLWDSFPENENYYTNLDLPIEDILFEEDLIESSITVNEVELVYGAEYQGQKQKMKGDLQNTIRLYSGFKNINPHLATNKRMWAYLSHTTFREYTLDRWPYENKEFDETKDDEAKYYSAQRSRYFVGPRRYLFDNSVSRLWWYGYLTYDPKYKFELTEVMLTSIQICADFLDAGYSKNRELGRGVLKALKMFKIDFQDADIPLCFRDCNKSINRFGAVTLMDVLSEDEMQELAYGYLVNAQKKFKK